MVSKQSFNRADGIGGAHSCTCSGEYATDVPSVCLAEWSRSVDETEQVVRLCLDKQSYVPTQKPSPGASTCRYDLRSLLSLHSLTNLAFRECLAGVLHLSGDTPVAKAWSVLCWGAGSRDPTIPDVKTGESSVLSRDATETTR